MTLKTDERIREGYQHKDKMQAFLQEIVQVCEKHQLWLAHEDMHGSFVVGPHSTAEWILAAIPAG